MSINPNRLTICASGQILSTDVSRLIARGMQTLQGSSTHNIWSLARYEHEDREQVLISNAAQICALVCDKSGVASLKPLALKDLAEGGDVVCCSVFKSVTQRFYLAVAMHHPATRKSSIYFYGGDSPAVSLADLCNDVQIVEIDFVPLQMKNLQEFLVEEAIVLCGTDGIHVFVPSKIEAVTEDESQVSEREETESEKSGAVSFQESSTALPSDVSNLQSVSSLNSMAHDGKRVWAAGCCDGTLHVFVVETKPDGSTITTAHLTDFFDGPIIATPLYTINGTLDGTLDGSFDGSGGGSGGRSGGGSGLHLHVGLSAGHTCVFHDILTKSLTHASTLSLAGPAECLLFLNSVDLNKVRTLTVIRPNSTCHRTTNSRVIIEQTLYLFPSALPLTLEPHSSAAFLIPSAPPLTPEWGSRACVGHARRGVAHILTVHAPS
jgi:hypothetical protein